VSARYILKIEAENGRFITNYEGGLYSSDCELPQGSEVIAPTLADAQRMVAGGAYSWVEGQPMVNPET
jgi:hypothetical protein